MRTNCEAFSVSLFSYLLNWLGLGLMAPRLSRLHPGGSNLVLIKGPSPPPPWDAQLKALGSGMLGLRLEGLAAPSRACFCLQIHAGSPPALKMSPYHPLALAWAPG